MKIKKIAAAVLTVAMAAAMFTGCSKNYEKVVTVDGVDFAPNMYLCAQYNAYNAAWGEVDEDVEDVMSATIEEMSAEEWIHAETIKNLQVYAWTEKTFEEMGLELLMEDEDYINQLVEYYWPYSEEIYTSNGVGKETYYKFNENSYKYEEIFTAMYGEKGEKAVSDAEYNKYMDENYARITGFYMPKQDRNGNELSEKDIEVIRQYCEEAVEKLNGGADLAEISEEYKTLAGDYLKLEVEYTDSPDNVIDSYIGKGSTAFSGDAEEKAFALAVDSEYVWAEMDEDFVVFKRIANFADEEELESIKSDLLTEMKSEEFVAYAQAEAEKLSVVENAEAVKYYSVNKIK